MIFRLVVGVFFFVSSVLCSTANCNADSTIIATEWVKEFHPSIQMDMSISNGLAVDTAGNVYVSGILTDADDDQTCLTLKYDALGNLVWNKSFQIPGGYTPWQEVRTATSGDGSVYVATIASSSAAATDEYYYIVKYDSGGNVVWTNNAVKTEYASFNRAFGLLPRQLNI